MPKSEARDVRWLLALYPALYLAGTAAMFAALRGESPATAPARKFGTAVVAFVALGTVPSYLLAAVAVAKRLRVLRPPGVLAVAVAPVLGTPLLLAGAALLSAYAPGPLAGVLGAAGPATLLLGAGAATLAGYALARAVPGWRRAPAT